MRRVHRSRVLPALILPLALLSAAAHAQSPCPVNYSQVIATHLGANKPLTSGRLVVSAINPDQSLANYTVPGVGIGLQVYTPDPVVTGAITVPLCLARSDRTAPVVGYHFKVYDTSAAGGNRVVLDVTNVAITSDTFDLDLYPFPTANPFSLTTSAYAELAGTPQVPSGAIDGVNRVFSITGNPPNGLLWRNGVLQAQPADYTLSGNTITYTAPPVSGDTHIFVGLNTTAVSNAAPATAPAATAATPVPGLPITDQVNGQTYMIEVASNQLVIVPYIVPAGAAAPPSSYTLIDIVTQQPVLLESVNGQLIY